MPQQLDPYENKMRLGAMIRDAAKAAVHNTDGPNDPDLQRLNNILVCEAFVSALADRGCMITRIPSTSLKNIRDHIDEVAQASMEDPPRIAVTSIVSALRLITNELRTQ